MKKKLTLIVTCVALVAAIAVGGTLAWFTDSKDVTNTVTFGNVKIDLTEPQFSQNNPNNTISNVAPGQTITKDPTIKNTGNNPCWIRVRIDATLDGKPVDLAFKNDVANDSNNDKVYTDMEKGNWEKRTDGYFYWKSRLDSNGELKVFNEATIPGKWDNDTAKGELKITVKAEALQATNNGNAYQEAKWPETVKPASQS